MHNIDIIIPVHNEAANLNQLISAVIAQTSTLPEYQFSIYLIDDGSTDNSAKQISALEQSYAQVHAILLARNFGKEIALSAGLAECTGDAAIMMDADLQHPPKHFAEMLTKWQAGADVVVGVRSTHGKNSITKSLGAKLFYAILQRISHTRIVPHATDFRLIDRVVIDAYNRFTERNRIVRGLIDWLGFERDYFYFAAAERTHGEASYSTRKLFKLATDSFVSMSFAPLKFSGYLGVIIIALSAPLGLFMFLDTYFLGNNYDFSGPASVGILTLFLVGIMLASLGLMSLYIANIHNEVVNRPLYVKRRTRRQTTKKS